MGLPTHCGEPFILRIDIMIQYFYLHGFASGVNSKKAQYFKTKFAEFGCELQLLDLNLGDFSTFQVSRVIDAVENIIANQPCVLIGSSLGGLISLILAEKLSCIQKLILLAPALEIKRLLPQIIGEENLVLWEQTQKLAINHIGYNQTIELHHEFIQDIKIHPDREFIQKLPTLIFHGEYDMTIPLKVSQDYVLQNTLARLHVLPSDHSLEDSLECMWDNSSKFLFDSKD